MDSIQRWLVENSGFQERYLQLLIKSVFSQFSAIEPSKENCSVEINWNYLLECAYLLSTSKLEKCQDTALRIAQYCMICRDTSQLQRATAGIILNQMANKPALKLSSQKEYLDPNFYRQLPIMSRLNWAKYELENMIYLSGQSYIHVNAFQKNFWNIAKENDWVSLSAPTSAGKSYIIYRWIGEYLLKNRNVNIVYLVPTRALIQQVENDLNAYLNTIPELDFSITTVPDKKYMAEQKTNLFVFTQERLHIFLSGFNNEPIISALFIDEAHKMGDRYRGILLQQVIERVVGSNPRTKIIFASPLTLNPEILLTDAPLHLKTQSIVSEDVAVNQNLIWLQQVPRKPLQWQLMLCNGETVNKIGTISLPNQPGSSHEKRLAILSYVLGYSTGGNVVYVNRPYDAERVAELLYQLVGEDVTLKKNEDLMNLSDTTKSVVHEKYGLAKVVMRGIAYHYGNMPLVIRAEIERLFKKGVIKFLVCTSTLIEGVNMPCKNIFLRGPRKGMGKDGRMKPGDFWNLAGRAGRLGTEFQGNIFCIDPMRNDLWNNGEAPRKRQKYQIHRTTDSILHNANELITFIKKGTPQEISTKEPQLEYMVSYLMSVKIREGCISNTTWARRVSPDTIAQLEAELKKITETLSIGHDIITRNPGISPISMNSLYLDFCSRTHIRKEPIEDLLPTPPASDDADKAYTAIFARINRTLGQKFGFTPKHTYFYALLVVQWMRGYPLSRLISSRIKKTEELNDTVNVPSIIRNTMDDVEQIARFEAPKYLSCYIDILKQHLAEEKRDDLIKEVQDLNIFLEFGVSQITQVSLMSLGLSRTSTILITENIVSDNWSKAEVLEWLRKREWEQMDVPFLAKREINELLEKHK